MTVDLLIRGGLVMDGTGSVGRRADVLVDAGRIAEVGSATGVDARQVIDASGSIVAPGFVDIHSHGDVTILVDPRAESAIGQGVTTVLVGNCGHSPAPIRSPEEVVGLAFGRIDADIVDWHDLAGYLEAVERVHPAVNVATLAGHLALRSFVLADPTRHATAGERQRMAVELDRALEAGAVGVSFGLEYPMGIASTTDELVELARLVARSGGLTAIHTRNRDARAAEAFDEAFDLAERAAASLQISHIAPRRGAPPMALAHVLARIDAARTAGLDVACDQHTRLHGITKLVTMLPPSMSADGVAGLRPALRRSGAVAAVRAFKDPIHKAGLMGEWERLTLYEAPGSPQRVGHDFRTLSADEGRDPFELIVEILLDAGDDAFDVLFIGEVQSQRDLDVVFASPTCVPESDATILTMDGPLAAQRFLGAYTWAAFYLRAIVRERGVISLAEGIRRLTSLPADRIGLRQRGQLARGYHADVTVFDPEVVADTGTVEDPNRVATGIRHVLVNGGVAMLDGLLTNARHGIALRRHGRGIPWS